MVRDGGAGAAHSEARTRATTDPVDLEERDRREVHNFTNHYLTSCSPFRTRFVVALS